MPLLTILSMILSHSPPLVQPFPFFFFTFFFLIPIGHKSNASENPRLQGKGKGILAKDIVIILVSF